MELYKPGDDITVEVVQVEKYVSDWSLYLIVREVDTHLEIVMDPYDASIIGRNFAIEALGNAPLGTQVTVTVEYIDKQVRRVRASRLKASEAALFRLMGKDKKRVVDAYIADVRENGLYLWLDYERTENYAPVGAFVHINNLLQRPDEMKLGEVCRVEVAPRNWRKPLRRTIDSIDNDVAGQLTKANLGNGLQWDELTNSFSLDKRMSFDQRWKLLEFSKDGRFRRTINMLFRRSNEPYVKILDVTGVENLAPLIGQTTKAVVTKITDDFVDLEVEGGLQTGIPKHKVLFDRDKELHEEITKGEVVNTWVEEVDLENVRAELTMLDPAKDPLNAYEPGQVLVGQVVNTEDFGAFVELSPGAQGMVHVSELAWYRVDKLSEIVELGQSVKVRIIDIDRAERRAELTMRLPENDPIRNYRVNQRIEGAVVGFTNDGKGAFIELEPGADGFLYKDEISPNSANDARDHLQEGQRITVRITEIDADARRIRVTRRGLYSRELFVPPSHAGMVIGSGGKVINKIMRSTQTYVQLEKDGFCSVQGVQQSHVDEATNRIEAIVATRIVKFNLGVKQTRKLIGKGGEIIRSIQETTGARIDTDRNSAQVKVTADNDNILERTLDKIRDAISYHEATIQVPSQRIGRVIGRGGATIKSIRFETNTWLDIAKDNSGQIRIEGTTNNDVHRAIALIQAQAGSAIIVSSLQHSLPSYVEERSPMPASFQSQASRAPEPFTYRPTAVTPPRAAQVTRKPATKTAIIQETVRVSSSQLAALQKRKGSFFQTLLGENKSALQKIRSRTGAQIRVDSAAGIVRVSGKTKKIVTRAVAEIRRTL
ncbi:MAG: S1 RNA-binding domain-containing protein [Chloroflexi bacterium]|nr:S1 RNA-binding domain-containing protein [Chloroflexota bacterium]